MAVPVESYSALPMLRDLVRGQAEKKMFTIRGGNDQLPKAFAVNEHTSTWTGWMQGALESGLRAAREIQEAP